MTEALNQTALLAVIDTTSSRVHALVERLGDAGMDGPADPAGWTGKDHLTHVTTWVRSMVVVLQGAPRHEGLGVEESLYRSRDYDAINEVIRRNTAGQSVAEARADFDTVLAQMRTLVEGMSEAELQEPYGSFVRGDAGPGSDLPMSARIHLNVGPHVEEHIEFIEIIAADTDAADTAEASNAIAQQPTKDETFRAMDASIVQVREMVARTGPDRLQGPTDAAGWTGKDHLTHLTAWVRLWTFLLERRDGDPGLGIPESHYLTTEFDPINEEIRQQTLSQSLTEAVEDFEASLAELRIALNATPEADLMQPYSWWSPDQPKADANRPIMGRIHNEVDGHVDEHLGYIERIVNE